MTSHVQLFADDCVIYREMASTNCANVLRSFLNYITDWCKNLANETK